MITDYCIFTTLGSRIDGSLAGEWDELVKTLSSCSVVLYMSYTKTGILFGTTLNVHKPQTRQHTVVCLAKYQIGSNELKKLEIHIYNFFSQVGKWLRNLDYEIDGLSSLAYWDYYSPLINNQKNQIIHSKLSTDYTQMLSYTFGRMMYGKSTACIAERNPESVMRYLSDFVAKYEKYLPNNCSFVVTCFAFKGNDISIITDRHAARVNINLDEGKLVDDAAYLECYTKTADFVKRSNSKKFINISNRLDMTNTLIQEMMVGFKRDVWKRNKYREFLDHETISFKPEMLEFPEPEKPPKPNKKSSAPMKTAQTEQNSTEMKTEHHIGFFHHPKKVKDRTKKQTHEAKRVSKKSTATSAKMVNKGDKTDKILTTVIWILIIILFIGLGGIVFGIYATMHGWI